MATMVKVETKTLVKENKLNSSDRGEIEEENLTEVNRGRILQSVSWFDSQGQYVHWGGDDDVDDVVDDVVDDHLDLSEGDWHRNKAEPEVRQGEVEDEQVPEQEISVNFWAGTF